MRIRSLVLGSIAPALVLLSAAPATAQQTVAAVSQQDPAAMLANAQRSMVTREELRTSLENLNALTNSPGYSATLKAAKMAEADLIRERLTDGDFHSGDVIAITVVGETSLSGSYQITPNRSILLPGGAEISLKGKLRSEIQDYLTDQLKQFVRDPIVRATPAIRLSIFGQVNKVGFFNESANMSLPDVIMKDGGGPGNNSRWEKSQIKRGDRIVVDGPEFQKAIYEGKTLDQLNVEAGDQIFVAQKPTGGGLWKYIGAAGSLLTVIVLGRQLF